jgi:hypothetical protein
MDVIRIEWERRVMQTKRGSRNTKTRQAVRYLLCDSSERSELRSDREARVRSPIQCLDRAIDENPGIVVVHFGPMPAREREALVELCAVLKRNSHTRKTQVLALLHGKHRGILEALAGAGVDFVKTIAEKPVRAIRLIQLIDTLGRKDRVEQKLADLCPHLHYDRADAEHEITLCGAYLDRLVLGGKWLEERCETQNHLKCEYFLNPRFKS